MKQFLFKHVPRLAITLSHVSNITIRKRIKTKLNETSNSPMFLSLEDLEQMNSKFPTAQAYGYDLDSLKQRGKLRSEVLYKIIQSKTNITNTLELGAMDGIVSYYLSKDFNKTCTCFDLDPQPIAELSNQNTKFVKGDINQLPFEDNSFDLSFSYNAFEHFHNPKTALLEIIRVTKPGGFIYLDFGPLFFAPKGLHWYRRINIPYCQILFEHKTLEDYCEKHNLERPEFAVGEGLNGWSIQQYRELWQEAKRFAKIKQYYEFPIYNNLQLVDEWSSYFTGKNLTVDDLITNRIQILLEVK